MIRTIDLRRGLELRFHQEAMAVILMETQVPQEHHCLMSQ